MTTRQGGKTHLGRVQVLRFFAAFAVLFAHLQHEILHSLMPDAPFAPFTAIDGGFGVDVFFVISGFIMYYISGDDFAKPQASGRFLWRRFLRVAPMYYLATLAMLAAAVVFADAVSGQPLGIIPIVTSFLFFPAENSLGEVAPILKLGWTLNFEMYFYVVFALALFFRKAVALAVMAGVLIGMMVLSSALPGAPTAIAFWGQPIALEFLYGIGIAIVYRAGVRYPPVIGWLLIIGGLLLTAIFRSSGLAATVDRAVYAGVPAALIFIGVVCVPSEKGEGLATRLLERAGDASYALYLSHPFAIKGMALIWGKLGLPALPWVFLIVVLVVAVLLSVALNLMVEKPLDKWLKRFSGRKKPPAAGPTDDPTPSAAG